MKRRVLKPVPRVMAAIISPTNSLQHPCDCFFGYSSLPFQILYRTLACCGKTS